MSRFNPFSLQGKTILITGASSGIGKATAIACAQMGATIIATARNEERLKDTLGLLAANDGQEHRMMLAELNDSDAVQRLVEAVDGVDGLVLCSCIAQSLPLQFCKPEKNRSLFDTNFFAPFELVRLLLKKKKIKKGASVVMLSSIGGTKSFDLGNGMYGASKAAVNSLARTLALELAPRQIRVNAICPGMVDTPIIHSGTISQEQLDVDSQRYPLKRYGRPEEIAYAAIYLLSDAAAWTTGSSLVVDGGITMAW